LCEETTSTSTRGGLLRIAESSMSSEIYELMKRSDEQAVVEKAPGGAITKQSSLSPVSSRCLTDHLADDSSTKAGWR